MLLSFAVGTYPFDYMASHDRNNPDSGSFTLVFFTKAAFLTVMAYVALAEPDSMEPVWVLFTGIMLLGIGVASAGAYSRARNPSSLPPTRASGWKARLKGLASIFRRKPPLPTEVQDCLRELDHIELQLKESIGVNSVYLPDDLFVAVRQMVQIVERTVHCDDRGEGAVGESIPTKAATG
jgi:hypothetical protein